MHLDHPFLIRHVLLAGLALAPAASLAGSGTLAQDVAPLWRIGERDGDDRELALAPGGYRDLAEDAFFVVGESQPAQDWPYAHPGPADGWGGGRSHSFTVAFALREAPTGGACRLELALVDAHEHTPPVLRVEVNGDEVGRVRPERGAGDASIYGDPAEGRPQTLTLDFPATRLVAGANEVRLTTLEGSWLLYDAVELMAPVGLVLAPLPARTLLQSVEPVRALAERSHGLVQPVEVVLRHLGEPAGVAVQLLGREGQVLAEASSERLERGVHRFSLEVPAVGQELEATLRLVADGAPAAERAVTLEPVRRLTVYVLPHSHTDIGYTEVQTAIEDKQVANLVEGIEAAHATAAYPQGSRFVWNVEVLWAADLYLERLSDEQRQAFFAAVRSGQVALNGMYLNELTGLCRPEELLQLFGKATELAEQTGVPVDSAMISDVPGLTWGTVTAMAQAGIRYLSTAPNYFDRIGDILVQWENKPFWWLSPSGEERVLVWIPSRGYALSHTMPALSDRFVADYQAGLDRSGYPYDIAYIRWSGHGDNAVPEPQICDFVRGWNERYAWPRLVISSTREAFRAFEASYGDELPVVRGDWTPYWEDGAGSSAAETALNRASSDRLSQAQALWALLDPAGFPAQAFEDAWRNVLLYSEHTWGAWCSVSDPENPFTHEQWAIKQGYALEADRLSRELLAQAKERRAPPAAEGVPDAVDVLNTTSWPRSELVTWNAPAGKDRVLDDHGAPVPSQRLSSGALAFLARDVPPFGARRFTALEGPAHVEERAAADGDRLANGRLSLRVDPRTGGIVELLAEGLGGNLVDLESGHALNDYLFLPGADLEDLRGCGKTLVRVGEPGPLVASLVAESEAPGCRRLVREVRLQAGADFVELVDLVDKERAAISERPGDWGFAQGGGKEGVHLAFPFDVPGGELLLDLPLGAMRPEADQIPSACKNWFSVGRWAEVSNAERAVTWVTLDAPLVEVGGITATLVGSQSDPAVWRKRVEPTQQLHSWVMNNHWGTNYRAYQEGEVTFRYAVRPRRAADPAEATRFATGLSQPLLVVPARGPTPAPGPRLVVEPADVVVIGLEPIEGGRALLVRLYNAADTERQVSLRWAAPAPVAVLYSDTGGRSGAPVEGSVGVPGFGVVTLRAELAR